MNEGMILKKVLELRGKRFFGEEEDKPCPFSVSFSPFFRKRNVWNYLNYDYFRSDYFYYNYI